MPIDIHRARRTDPVHRDRATVPPWAFGYVTVIEHSRSVPNHPTFLTVMWEWPRAYSFPEGVSARYQICQSTAPASRE